MGNSITFTSSDSVHTTNQQHWPAKKQQQHHPNRHFICQSRSLLFFYSFSYSHVLLGFFPTQPESCSPFTEITHKNLPNPLFSVTVSFPHRNQNRKCPLKCRWPQKRRVCIWRSTN